ncbi:hypothetical protein FIE12Z_6898 [Fusarium flagelliforme]|uniref:Heterokaryon incompatibility domain-containing protein n=1 Tax=Fusarium flagelliforme TaxID=2675880 RepID=A0A395MN71_9HYPO|nr:hypothetical protein FIE12Z_6898 [Fusarium flagelliforme]
MSENLSEHDRKSPYLILSYQWGKGNNPARTTSKNLEERKVEIKVQNMPKTIRDAIDITRLIGIRYLWVDAVCIIQADTSLGLRQQDDVAIADWEQESMNMAAYYTSALCCIAATSAKDSSEGFLTERRVMRYGYKEWHPPANVFAPSPHAVRRQFRNSLLSRGWCLQEWLLSTRILHWTSNGLIWQCPHGFFWEGQSGFQGELLEWFTDIHDGPRSTNDCIFDLGFNNLDTEAICRILFCDDKNAVGKAWTDLVSHFVQMNLSFSTDRLVAIQGIATRLSERHGFEYFAGVFRSHCVDHLLWSAKYPRNSLESGDSFPTWSWASSRGEIDFFHDFEAATSLVSDLQPFPSAEKQGNFRNPANKELRFTAPLVKLSDLEPIEAEFEAQGGSMESEETLDSSLGRRHYVFRPESPIWGGSTCRVHLDNLATPLPFTDRAYLLALRDTLYQCEGLVVQKVKNEQRVDPRDKMNVYERIGIFYTWGEMTDVADTLAWETKVIII